MSFLDNTPWLANDEPPVEESSFRRGLRSGVTSLKGQFHALAGNVGEAVGATDFANERYARSRELQDQAAQEAPGGSFHDVHDLRSGYDYVTGVLGQAAPMAVPAVAAALLTKRPILAPTAVMAGPEAGDIVQRQQADPASMQASPERRLANAVGGGVASAAVQSAVPGMTAERVAGRTAASAVKNATNVAGTVAQTAVVGGATAAGGEALKQAAQRQSNPELAYDPEAIKEAGAGGAVAGGVLGVPGGIAEGMHGAAHRAGTSVGEAVKGTLAKTTERVSDAARGLFDKKSPDDEATARAIAKDKPLEPIPPGVDPAPHIAQSDAKATEWATEKATGWIANEALPEAFRAKAAELLPKVSEPAARIEIATMDLARKGMDKVSAFHDHITGEKGEAVKEKVTAALNAVKEHVTEFVKNPNIVERVRSTQESISSLLKNDDINDTTKGKLQAAAANIGDRAAQAWVATVKKATQLKDEIIVGAKAANAEAKRMADDFFKESKKSEDYSGVRALIANELMPAIKKTHPEIMDNPEAMNKLADSIRMYVDRARKGERPDKDTEASKYIRSFLGDDAAMILDKVYTAIHEGTPEENAKVASSILALNEKETAHSGLLDVVKGARENKATDPTLLVEGMHRYARGEHVNEKMTPPERELKEKLARQQIDKEFGKNADRVIEAFNKAHEQSQAEAKLEATRGKEGDPGEGDDGAVTSGAVDHDLPETEIEREPPRVYRGKDKAPILSLEAHRRDFKDTPSQVERLMERAKKDNPDRNVSFVKAEDFERDYGEKLNIPEGKDIKDYGVVAAEGTRQEGRITDAQARAMRFDENRNTVTSKSRIKLEDGTVLDAYKITKQTLEDLPYIEGESNARRTARAFFDGLGSALIHFNTKLDGKLPDSTVIAVRNGVKVTVGDISHYKGKGEYSVTAKIDLESEIKDMQRRITKEPDQEKRVALMEEMKDMESKLAYRLKNEGKNTDGNLLDKAKNEHQVYEIDPEGNIHEAALEHDKTGEMERTAEDANRRIEVTRERGRLLAAAEKPLKDVTVTTKLVDENGRELVWTGNANDHPGRMSAEKAVNEIRERRDTLKKLLECLKA